MHKAADKIGPDQLSINVVTEGSGFEEPYHQHATQDICKICENRRLKGITKNHPFVYFPLGGFLAAKGPKAIYP